MHPDPLAARPRPQRLPKLAPVALAGMAGIAAADWTLDWRSSWCCLGLAVAVLWFGLDSRRPALLLVVTTAFALVHSLSRESRERFPLAERLEDGRRIEVVVSGVVTDAPVGRDGSLRFPMRVESLRTMDGGWSVRSGVMMRWRLASGLGAGVPECGDRVTATGWMAAAKRARNPGQFDAAGWFARQGMVAELEVGRLRIDESAAGLVVKRLALRARESLAEAITGGLSDRPAEAAVIKAMVLGTRDDMAGEIDEAFRHSGTLHIFSVSGLHVGFVAIILWRVLNLLRLTRRQAAWASIPLVIFYALVTGWQPAAVRSASMASVVLLGIGLNRPPAFFNSLCLAALLILAADTHQLFMPGAQLSFVVIGVIAAGGHPVAGRIKSWMQPDAFLPRAVWSRGRRWGLLGGEWLANMSAVSLVAAAGSAPLTLWHFQLATPVSLAANLVHVPLAGLILSTAGLSAACYAYWPAAASVFTHANSVFAYGCLLTAGWFAAVPGGSVLWNPRSLAENAASCRITVFDVGDGGAVLIRTSQGQAWLLDTGRPGAFRGIVRPGLTFHAVRNLDGLILSHGDHDHVGGASEALSRLDPNVLGHPAHPSRSPALRAALADGAAVARPLVAGDVIPLDDTTTLTVLWPPAKASLPLADDGCLVLRLDCAGRTMLLSNDTGFLAERALLQADPRLHADIWVRGRHASDLSGSEDFVRQLRPSVVVCAGRDGIAGVRLPADGRVLLESVGATVYDQAVTGAVEICILGDGSLAHRGFFGPGAAR